MTDIQKSCIDYTELLLQGCKRNHRDMVSVYLTQDALETIIQALHSTSKLDTIKTEVSELRDNYERINNPWGDRWEYSNPYDAVLKIINRERENADGR